VNSPLDPSRLDSQGNRKQKKSLLIYCECDGAVDVRDYAHSRPHICVDYLPPWRRPLSVGLLGVCSMVGFSFDRCQDTIQVHVA